MGEIYQQMYKGWSITVWLSNIEIWEYIMSRGEEYKDGWVYASHRMEAVQNAIVDAKLD